MNPSRIIAALALLLLSPLYAREFHVATTGNDSSDGSSAHPLRTIQTAAHQAMESGYGCS